MMIKRPSGTLALIDHLFGPRRAKAHHESKPRHLSAQSRFSAQVSGGLMPADQQKLILAVHLPFDSQKSRGHSYRIITLVIMVTCHGRRGQSDTKSEEEGPPTN